MHVKELLRLASIEARTRLHQIKYKFLNIVKKEFGVSHDSEIVVSLTTFPARIGLCHLAIETIMNQTYKAKKIVLWLSEDQLTPNDITPALKRLVKRGLEIHFVPNNIRAYKKLIYTLQDESLNKFKIVTADDDVFYPNQWLEKLQNASNEHPNAVICFRAYEMNKISESSLLSYRKWHFAAAGKTCLNIFPNGVSGVLYKASFFDPEVFNLQVSQEICPLNDDIWFKAMTLKRKIKCIKIPHKETHFLIVSGSQKESLLKFNVLANENDKQLEAVFTKYNLYHYIDS